MRAQLNLLVVATTAVVLAAFLAPLGIVLRNTTQERAIADGTNRAQSAARLVALGQTPSDAELPLTVFYADGEQSGEPAQRGPSVELASRGEAFSAWADGGVEVLVPVEGLTSGTAVVRVLVPEDRLHDGVTRSWLVLGAVGIGLVVLSLLLADRLGRRLVGSVTALAATADSLAAGQQAVRHTPSGPPEVRRVGAELNRLAARIEELLRAEREEVANLAHRLRTPLTALRLDVDAVRDQQDQARLGADVEALRREVDELIRTARRPVRSGVHPQAELTAVVAERAAFWSALADDSGRVLELVAAPDPLPVAVPAQDLAAALDALLDNVFSHTADGAPIRLRVATSARGVTLTVEDGGPGFAGSVTGTGTGLGLDIARRTVEAAGGTMRLGTSPLGGALVELAFPALV
jgi:signal transduction histidine kinase